MRKSLLLAIIISLFIGNCNTSHAQTDTEFWFVKPNITYEHGNMENFKIVFTTRDFATDVVIEMPAEPAFTPISISIPAYTTYAHAVLKTDPVFSLMENTTIIDELSTFPANRDNIGNKAILVTSTAPISAYLTSLSDINSDIYSLKGKNGIGTEFIIPFQEHGYNQADYYYERAFSSIDIIGIENETVIEIIPPAGKTVYRSGLYPNETNPFTITLNRGEVYTCAPGWDATVTRNNIPNSGWWGVEGSKHLGGIIVKVLSGTGVSIVKKDDSVRFGLDNGLSTGGWDIIGDQWIPYKGVNGSSIILGNEYVVMRGVLDDGWEFVYVAAPENNTRIWYGNNIDTTNNPVSAVVNRGEQHAIQFDNGAYTNNYMDIISNKPLSVLHVSGYGTEMGGAVLPPIDKCNGSTSVSFTRDIHWPLFINIIVRAGAEDNFLVEGIVRNDILNPSSFVPVGTSGDWMAAQIYFADGDVSDFPVGITRTISNTEDVFHLGLINGNSNGGCRYGYYSDFNEIKVGALFIQSEISPSTAIRACRGDSIQLYASGGTDYQWWPSMNLSNAEIACPKVFADINTMYYVEVSGACNIKDTANISIEVNEVPEANFTISSNSGTSPLTINISNIDSAYNHKWYWDDNDLTAPDYETESNLSFTHTYLNSGNTVKTKNLTLIVENEFGCSDTLKKEITINPETAAVPENSYWFVVQEISEDHIDRPVRFVFTTTDSPADITIEMPANPSFTPINISVPANTTEQSVFSTSEQMNSIENKQLIDQLSLPTNEQNNISNKGILITSTAPITAYYEVNATNNSDLWTLKGESGLGEDFYIPFQDIGQNRDRNHSERGYSSIDIISINDNTEIEIFPSNYVFKNGENPSFLNPFTITLNKGEVYTLAPAWDTTVQHDSFVGWFGVYRDQHLGGTHIHVKNEDKVAVVIKDDSVCEDLTESPLDPRAIASSWGGWDIIADQLVPLENLGTEYIALRGDLSSNEEYLFVVATDNNTRIWWTPSSVDTTIAVVDIIAQEGEQIRVSFPNTELYKYIISNKKLSILHVSGTGTEMGGAILPSVDNSAGSTKVGFSRSRPDDFHLNLIVNTDAKDGFLINESSPTFFNESNFTDIPGTQWSVARIQNISTTNIPVETATIISNTKGVFHLGVMNEISVGTGCRYGYFSDFSSKKPSLQIIGYNSTIIQTCPDNELKFKATGGSSYFWSPTSYLDDPTSATPKAILPTGIHTYSVTITRPIFGDTTLYAQVEVFENSDALFNVNTTSGCSPLPIELENLSTEADTFLIDWENDGIFDTPFDNTMNQTILHSFNNTTDHDTVYTILLKAWHKYRECYDIYEKQIIVHPQINAGFSIDQNKGCSPLNINITNNSTGEDSVLISFGDGTIEVFNSLTSINHIYQNKGSNVDTTQIEFIAYNNFGCTDTVRTTVIVYPEVKAHFTPTLTNIASCDSLIVDFNASIIAPGLASTATYTWDFGDGATSSLADPQHVYKNMSSATPVTRRVDLHVETPLGCSFDTSSFIDVYPLVNANISIDQAAGCSPLTVDAIATTFVGIPTANYQWTYDDSYNPNISNPIAHVYPINPPGSDDVYTLRLDVSDLSGTCTDFDTKTITVYDESLADFDPKGSIDCDPYTVTFNNLSQNSATYKWDFDDGGTTSTDFEPIYEFKNTTAVTKNFNVQLEVTSDEGCTNTFISQVNVFPAFEADFDIDISEGCSPLTVTISNNYVGTECYWFWDKDDNIINPEILTTADSAANYTNFTKTFVNNSGTSRIDSLTLIVGNGNGCYKIFKRALTIHSAIDAQFATNPTFGEGCNPLTVNFTNTTMNGVLYNWDFGDGENSTLNSPSHLFINSTTTDRVFYASLTTESLYGCTDSIIQPIVVYSNVSSDFSIINKEGCSPLDVTINNTSLGNATDSYQWFIDNVFIDGSPTNTTSFQHAFVNSGSTNYDYEIKLIATNQHGCTYEKTDIITVYPELVVEITDSVNVSCFGVEDGFISVQAINGVPPYSYTWSTGQTTPTISDLNLGIYSVTTTDAKGCSALNTITIQETPQINLNIEYTNVSCYGASDGTITVVPTDEIELFIWSTGATNSFISNLSPGIYTVTVTNNEGCISTGSHNILEPDSISIITDSYTESICPSQEGQIKISIYGGIPPYSYIWSSGENTQDIYNLNAGNYNVSVVDINSCFSSKNYLIDSATSFNDEEICFVSVDPEVEMNRIIWEKTPNKGIEYYKVYRHNPNADIYQNVALLPFSDGGCFIDSLANIQNETFKYKISSINKCATESSLSGFHKSLYLNTTNTSETVILEWEAYEIESGNPDIIGYIIFRGSDPNALNPIDTVSSNESNYLDNDPEALLTKFYYRIAGVKSSSCILDTNNEFNLIYSNLVKTDINTNIYSLADQSINLNIFPNPFKDEISIEYKLYSKSNILIEVYDIIGKKVTTLNKNKEDIGFHKHLFNPKDYGYSSGIYYVKLIIDNQTISKKIIQIK